MPQDFSFDIVSKTEMQEVTNAIQQAQKELAQRFDFKGSKSSIELTAEEIVLVSDDEGKLRSVKDILETKLVKRGVSLKALDYATLEQASGGTVRQKAKIVQGIEIEKAKAIVKAIKDAKLKVQASIQSDQVRVTGRAQGRPAESDGDREGTRLRNPAPVHELPRLRLSPSFDYSVRRDVDLAQQRAYRTALARRAPPRPGGAQAPAG